MILLPCSRIKCKVGLVLSYMMHKNMNLKLNLRQNSDQYLRILTDGKSFFRIN